MKSGIGIFVKGPEPGQVKTRLAPAVTAEEAAKLYEAFVRDTVEMVRRLPCHARVIAYWPDTAKSAAEQLAGHGFMLWAQEGADLGERMSRFFDWSFSRGIERAVIIGSDSPTLPGSIVEEALEALYTSPVVLGPSLDGGYYLIGLSKPMGDIFVGIDWGSNRVLGQTVAKLSDRRERFHLLPPWYDVDDPQSLRLLVDHMAALAASQDGAVPSMTYDMIRQLRLWNHDKR